jgi:hypothetical protein
MSGALARDWEFSEEKLPPSKAESPYSHYFERQDQAESLYHYAYNYQERLRPRRTHSFPLLDWVLGWLALLPKRWIIVGVLGLLILGWLLSGGVAKLLPNTAVEIYQFEGKTVAPASSESTRPITGNYSLLRGPTIAPTKINAILRQYNSPAVGFGQSMYDLGVRYGIDPAYALAFFIHESSAGTQGVATATRSIGNIRCTSGYDCLQTTGNGSFRRYASWEAGIEDWYKLIKELYIGEWGLKTLEQVIPVYAPSADRNNPIAYIQQVAKMVDSWQDVN